MSTEGMAVNIRKSWKTVFSKISPVLGNVEYNYHDSLQARLMSDGTFVDQPSVYTLSSSSFYRSRVNKEAGWELGHKDAEEPFLSKATKIPYCFNEHLRGMHSKLKYIQWNFLQ